MVKQFFVSSTDITNFSGHTWKIGTVLGEHELYRGMPTVVPIHMSINKIVVGISLNDVIKFNRNKFCYDKVLEGGKVEILTIGEIIVKMNKRLQIPLYQPIYVDNKTSQLTWKKLGKEVGYTTKHQDKDGFVQIKVDFTK